MRHYLLFLIGLTFFVIETPIQAKNYYPKNHIVFRRDISPQAHLNNGFKLLRHRRFNEARSYLEYAFPSKKKESCGPRLKIVKQFYAYGKIRWAAHMLERLIAQRKCPVSLRRIANRQWKEKYQFHIKYWKDYEVYNRY